MFAVKNLSFEEEPWGTRRTHQIKGGPSSFIYLFIYLFLYLFFIYSWPNTAKIFYFTWKIAMTSIPNQFTSTHYINSIKWKYVITEIMKE